MSTWHVPNPFDHFLLDSSCSVLLPHMTQSLVLCLLPSMTSCWYKVPAQTFVLLACPNLVRTKSLTYNAKPKRHLPAVATHAGA